MHFKPAEKKPLDCRREAQTIRALASDIKNPTAQEQLFLIASLYDKLADLSDYTVPPPDVVESFGRPCDFD